jgi:hypothetical protein
MISKAIKENFISTNIEEQFLIQKCADWSVKAFERTHSAGLVASCGWIP